MSACRRWDDVVDPATLILADAMSLTNLSMAANGQPETKGRSQRILDIIDQVLELFPDNDDDDEILTLPCAKQVNDEKVENLKDKSVDKKQSPETSKASQD